MAYINIITPPSFEEQLRMMREDCSFDVADGVGMDGSTLAEHEGGDEDSEWPEEALKGIKAPKSPPKVGKMYVANRCVFDCKYCGHRTSRNFTRDGYLMEPARLAEAAVDRSRNPNGIFISSAIHKCPDYTQELINETVRLIRTRHGYNGYVHAKIMPSADPGLIEEAGWYADRLSVNIELPDSSGYPTIARQKTRENILGPMGEICARIKNHRDDRSKTGRRYAKSGQTTQMMPGIMGETDRKVITVADAMYRRFSLRRVYYSPFGLPADDVTGCMGDSQPKWRGRRLYQADRLLQLYGFTPDEIVPDAAPSLDFDIDPKAAYAMRRLDMYPIEVNTASYEELIRVPGIGITSARKIIEARKHVKLTHASLEKMRVWLKRANFFVTCGGKYEGGNWLMSEGLRARVSDITANTPAAGVVPAGGCCIDN